MASVVENSHKFEQAVRGGNIREAEELLQTLNVQLMELDSLPPLSLDSTNAMEERIMARGIYEHAVMLAIKNSDKPSFQNYMSILRPYYMELRSALPPSEFNFSITGLHLLYLLVENELSAFHSELELLSQEQLAHPAISFCTQLDQHLMIGSYDQVMQAASHPPVEEYSFFLTSLLETAATDILMFTSTTETRNFLFAKHPELQLDGDVINLQSHRGDSVKLEEERKSHRLIEQTLTYAAELERIV